MNSAALTLPTPCHEPAGIRTPAAPAAGRRQVYFDSLRGGAALLVCAGHLRHFLFVEWREVSQPTVLAKLFYALTSLGHASVVVFFVLSGFLVGGSVLSQVRAQRWSWGNYASRRLTRLWVVLVPALALTALWDWLGQTLGGAAAYAGAYSALHSSGPTPATPANHTWATAMGNLCFLQTVWTSVFGSNGPLWSLANEFWYYVLFPLGVLSVRGNSGKQRAVSLALGAGLAGMLPGELTRAGLTWLMGVAMAAIPAASPAFNCGAAVSKGVADAAAEVLGGDKEVRGDCGAERAAPSALILPAAVQQAARGRGGVEARVARAVEEDGAGGEGGPGGQNQAQATGEDGGEGRSHSSN
ncbi:MAG: acyltransferase [Verrucomicrobia bacterium]|nr:acyltransferase [Verrucomicrobiota bacterium]NDF01306.1 acyltransferase [Verrucomicrobiota bacterium]